MRFAKIGLPAIFSTVTNLGYIRSRIFDGTVFSKKNTLFWQCIHFPCYFLYNFMKVPRWLVWKFSNIV